jgi:IPT/TIG domain-containing protein/PASTA domain-containing protein
VVVGQVAPPNPPAICEYPADYDEFQLSIATGASYTVPTAGVITSWSTNAAAGAGQSLGFKVFRPLGGGNFLVVAEDRRTLTPSTLNTYLLNVPVQPGDILGLAIPAGTPTACEFATGLSSDVMGYNEGLTPVGGVVPLEDTFTGSRLNVSATLLPPPVISGVTPAAGSIKGSTVVISGANFANVTAVSFGSVPATSFTVNSEGQITAVAPASRTLGSVPVVVTTAAGAATSAQPFTYEGCRVPKLKGKKLKASKRMLRKSDCRIGKVKKLDDATAKTGKVVKQNPKPGQILIPGAKVKVTLDEA